MITLIRLHFNPEQCTSMILASNRNNVLPYRYTKHHMLPHALPGNGYRANYEFTIFTLKKMVTFLRCFRYSGFFYFSCYQRMYILTPANHLFYRTLLLAYRVSFILSSLHLSRHLLFVHDNVQIIVPKLDILLTEL